MNVAKQNEDDTRIRHELQKVVGDLENALERLKKLGANITADLDDNEDIDTNDPS